MDLSKYTVPQLKQLIRNYNFHYHIKDFNKQPRARLEEIINDFMEFIDNKVVNKKQVEISKPKETIKKVRVSRVKEEKRVMVPTPELKTKADEIAISNIKEPIYRKLNITQATDMKEKYNKLFKSTLKTEEENYLKNWSVKDLFDVKEKLLSVSGNDRIFKDVVKKYNLYNLNEPNRITKKKPYKTLKEAVLRWLEENRFSMSEELRNLKNILYNLTDRILEEKRTPEPKQEPKPEPNPEPKPEPKPEPLTRKKDDKHEFEDDIIINNWDDKFLGAMISNTDYGKKLEDFITKQNRKGHYIDDYGLLSFIRPLNNKLVEKWGPDKLFKGIDKIAEYFKAEKYNPQYGKTDKIAIRPYFNVKNFKTVYNRNRDLNQTQEPKTDDVIQTMKRRRFELDKEVEDFNKQAEYYNKERVEIAKKIIGKLRRTGKSITQAKVNTLRNREVRNTPSMKAMQEKLLSENFRIRNKFYELGKFGREKGLTQNNVFPFISNVKIIEIA